jgi:hypothetical protein
MTPSGGRQLKHYPTDILRLACTHCPRKGQYRKATLILRFGKNITLTRLRTLLARCEHEGQFGNSCGVYYVELKPKA